MGHHVVDDAAAGLLFPVKPRRPVGGLRPDEVPEDDPGVEYAAQVALLDHLLEPGRPRLEAHVLHDAVSDAGIAGGRQKRLRLRRVHGERLVGETVLA